MTSDDEAMTALGKDCSRSPLVDAFMSGLAIERRGEVQSFLLHCAGCWHVRTWHSRALQPMLRKSWLQRKTHCSLQKFCFLAESLRINPEELPLSRDQRLSSDFFCCARGAYAEFGSIALTLHSIHEYHQRGLTGIMMLKRHDGFCDIQRVFR